MSWSKITRILDVAVASGAPRTFNTAIVRTQRLTRERGIFTTAFDGNPNAPTGSLKMFAALSELNPMAPCSNADGTSIFLNMADHNALTFGAHLNTLPILPLVQFRTTDTVVGTSRQLKAWLVE